MANLRTDTRPVARLSSSGTPPPIRPFTSRTDGPSGVNLTSVWWQPCRTSRTVRAAAARSRAASRSSGPRSLGRMLPVSRKGSANGKRPVTARWLIDPRVEEALDRHDIGEARGRRLCIPEESFENPAGLLGAARRRCPEDPAELCCVGHGDDVSAAAVLPGLQHRRELHGSSQTLRLWPVDPVGEDQERRDGESGVPHHLALQLLVGEPLGHGTGMEVQIEPSRHLGQQDRSAVVQCHDPGRVGGAERLDQLARLHARRVHHDPELPQQALDLGHPRLVEVDHPDGPAQAPSRLTEKEGGGGGAVVGDEQPALGALAIEGAASTPSPAMMVSPWSRQRWARKLGNGCHEPPTASLSMIDRCVTEWDIEKRLVRNSTSQMRRGLRRIEESVASDSEVIVDRAEVER